MKYERLTKRDDASKNVRADGKQIYARLWALENGIEGGTVLLLPCKMGGRLFMIVERRTRKSRKKYYSIKTTVLAYHNVYTCARRFGDTVFGTFAEAVDGLAKYGIFFKTDIEKEKEN